MKEKQISLMFRHTVIAVGAKEGGAFIYKIPDPSFFTKPDGTRVPSSRRPFDIIMAAGKRVWAIELKMMRRKKPWRPPEVKAHIEEHQYAALRMWELCGGVTARSVVAAYNTSDRRLWCYMMLNGEFRYVFSIGRQGPDFSPEDVTAHFFHHMPRVIELEDDRLDDLVDIK